MTMFDETSSQVAQIIEVLAEIERARPSNLEAVRRARRDAVVSVSKRRGIAHESTADKISRKLELSTGEFDDLVLRWAVQGSPELEGVVLAHVARGHEREDRQAVQTFFRRQGRVQSDEEEFREDLTRRRPGEEEDEEAIDADLVARERDRDYGVEDAWSRKKVRRGQARWRTAVLANFERRCCVCGLDLPALLDACHIRSWNSAPDQRLDPLNGLSLCVLHHRAVDRGLLRVGADGVISAAPGLGEEASPQVEAVLLAYCGRSIQQPSHPVQLASSE